MSTSVNEVRNLCRDPQTGKWRRPLNGADLVYPGDNFVTTLHPAFGGYLSYVRAEGQFSLFFQPSLKFTSEKKSPFVKFLLLLLLLLLRHLRKKSETKTFAFFMTEQNVSSRHLPWRCDNCLVCQQTRRNGSYSCSQCGTGKNYLSVSVE